MGSSRLQSPSFLVRAGRLFFLLTVENYIRSLIAFKGKRRQSNGCELLFNTDFLKTEEDKMRLRKRTEIYGIYMERAYAWCWRSDSEIFTYPYVDLLSPSPTLPLFRRHELNTQLWGRVTRTSYFQITHYFPSLPFC